jgi:hypothetical protein
MHEIKLQEQQSWVVGTTLGTMSLPSAHSVDAKGRLKFGKVVRTQIVFEERNIEVHSVI